MLVAGIGYSPRTVRAQDAVVTVDLEVIDADSGHPVENVVVRLPELDTYLLTDSVGRLSFVDIPVGAHRMILTRMGYEAQAGEFTIERAGPFRVALTPVLVRTDAGPGEVRGRVIDPDTREGIAGAEVIVAGVLRRATDKNGWFTVELVPAGAHVFEAEYLGRQTLRDSIFVLEGETLEVEVPLPFEAIAIEGLTVTTQSKYLTDIGFYRRERAGAMFRGRQWIAEELEGIFYLEDLILEVPAIMRAIPRAGEGTVTRFEAFRCRLSIYIDGFPMDSWLDLDHIDPARVAALEVFHGRTMPFRYVDHCGVILIWLKRR